MRMVRERKLRAVEMLVDEMGFKNSVGMTAYDILQEERQKICPPEEREILNNMHRILEYECFLCNPETGIPYV